jgi:hypothetical protein
MTLVLPTGYKCNIYIRQKLNIPSSNFRSLLRREKEKNPLIAVICPLISIIEDQMEEAKDLGMSSVCAINDEHRGHKIREILFDIWIGRKRS